MFFKKEKKVHELLELNYEVLQTKMQKIADRMHVFKQDPCMDDFRELIKTGKSLALLDSATAQNDMERIKRQAKFEIYDEISQFVERWVNEKPKPKETEENKKPRGTLHMFRRVSNQAGSSF
jgi:hypothetical protein